MTKEEFEAYKQYLKKIKYEIMTLDDYEIVFNRLGGHNIIKSKSDSKWVLWTMCHNIDPFQGSPKLEFYIENRSLHCYTQCACSMDIFHLVQKRMELTTNDKWSIFKCAKWVCEQCNIDFNFKEDLVHRENNNIYNWQSNFAKYLKHNSEVTIQIRDKSILDFFDHKYHTDWLDYGISEETLDKYHIGWYNYRNQITIPCFNQEGDLVGIRIRNMNPTVDIKYMPLKMLNGIEYNFPTSQLMYGCNYNANAIEKKKTVWLVEGEKSVLIADTWFGDDNIALALYGHELQKAKLKYLLSLGVENVVIMLDSDYTETCEIEIKNGKAEGSNREYVRFYNNVLKIYNACKPYMKNIEVCYNNQGWDGYKYSPFDFGREGFDILYNNRERIEL